MSKFVLKLRLAKNAAAFVEEDAFEVHFEGLGVGGIGEGFFLSDFAFFDEVEEGLVEILHAVVAGVGDGGAEFFEAVFFDHFANRAGVDEDFQGGDDAAADFRNHALADDRLKGGRELFADLFAFVGFEEFEHAGHGLAGVGGVDGREDEVTGVGATHGGGEANGVAHFTDHDDVRILAQNVFEALIEGDGVEADFALFNGGFDVFKNELDRIFESNNVIGVVLVDVLDHGGQRGGFAGTGGAGDENDSTGSFGDFFENGEQAKFVELGNAGFNVAHGQAPFAALLEAICTKAADAWNEIGEVAFAIFVEALFEMFGNDVFDNIGDPFVCGRGRFNGDELLMNAENDGTARLNVDVGSVTIH